MNEPIKMYSLIHAVLGPEGHAKVPREDISDYPMTNLGPIAVSRHLTHNQNSYRKPYL